MASNTKIQFDDLDLKCLTEMPLILEVISATGNKLTRLFMPLYSEMNKLIKTNLKSNWEIGKDSFECRIFPLTSQEGTRLNIIEFETAFKIESALYLSKKVNGKEVNNFWAYFGYNCCKDEYETANYFYFSICKVNLSDKYGGVLQELNFYNKIQSQLTDYTIEIEHRDKGDKREKIELHIDDFSIEKIQDGFNVFKKLMLIPFLKTIK
jgi:hypothetical protein